MNISNLLLFYLFFTPNLHQRLGDCKFINQLPELKTRWDYAKAVGKIERQWAQKIHKDKNINPARTIFYPFGGGDLIFPINIFPNFRKLILVGLEPAGVCFNLMNRDGIVSNLSYLLERGFLVTRSMEKFSKTGMLTMLLLQIEGLNGQVLSYKIINKGCEIRFKLEGVERTVVYLQLNLHNDNYTKWKDFIINQGAFSVLLKSSSFALQQQGFDKIRDFILKRANLIIQDNTGVALRDLVKSGYDINLFGWYKQPYGDKSFMAYHQPDLKEAYEQVNPELLPFAAGYGSHIIPSNFLFATKRKRLL
jgi:hypothetical protein